MHIAVAHALILVEDETHLRKIKNKNGITVYTETFS
jgi:hypothetical protein